MKTAEQWIMEFDELGFNHSAGCICDRCKNGRETFLLPSDIKAVQLDAWKQGMADAAEYCKGWVLAKDAKDYINKKKDEDQTR